MIGKMIVIYKTAIIDNNDRYNDSNLSNNFW